MNILQIAPAYYPAISIGGPIYSTISFSEILSKNNNLTTLTTQLGLSEIQKNNIIYDKENAISENHILIYKKYFGPANFTFSLSTIFWLLKNTRNYDVIILQGIWNFPFIIASIIARLYKIPYIVFPHGTLYKETVLLKSAAIKKLFFVMAIKKMLKKAKYVCFTTNDEMRKVLNFLNIKLNSYIIPNVVKKEDFSTLPIRGKFRQKFAINSDTIVLLHFGRITKKKGLEYTLQALKSLINNKYNVELIIAGGDEEGYKSNIMNLINDFNIEKFVHFTGLLNREEALNILVDSDIFVLPSYSENFGIAIVESMYCKLPVVISDNVGIAEDIEAKNAGIVFNLNAKTESLEFYLKKLIENPLLRLEFANSGCDFAENNYDIKVLEKAVNNLLNNAKK
jgi:glycosyltransferase involved in cell wall biosynthesis